MAAKILKGLKVSGEVSSATIKADGKVVEAKHCKITEASAKDGKISFTRLDESSPWPIIPRSKPVFDVLPEIADLSQYMLKVEGLAPGDYHVSINGKEIATVSDKDLAKGWNVAGVLTGPFGDRAIAIDALIAKLQSGQAAKDNVPGGLNAEWRAASKEKNAEKLAAAQKAIEEIETEIQKAVQPVPWKFEIAK
jgi:hypothetical protein